MSEEKSQSWYLRIEAGEQYGPVDMATLLGWAMNGKVLSEDTVSRDGEAWAKASEVAELQMDTFIRRPDGVVLGPFHANAIAALEFEGHFPADSRIFKKGEEFPSPPAEETGRSQESEDRSQNGKRKRKEKAMSETQDIENMVAEARDAVAERDREIETLRQTLVEREERIAQLEAAQEQAVSGQRDIEELRVALQAEQEKSTTLTQSVEMLTAEVTELRVAAVAVDQEAAEGRDREIGALRQTLAEREEEIATLRDQASHRDASLGRTSEEIETLRQALAEREGEVKALQDSLAEREERFAKVEEAAQGQWMAEKNKVEAFRQAQEERDEEIGKMRIAVKAADETVAAAVEARIAAQEELDALRKEYQELLAFSNTRDAELIAKVEALSVVPKEGEEARRAWAMELQNMELKRDVEELKRRYDRDLEESEERRLALEQQMKEMSRREGLLRDQLAQLQQTEGDYGSLSSQLKRREGLILKLERAAEEARLKSKEIETALLRRIDELERGASTLLNPPIEN